MPAPAVPGASAPATRAAVFGGLDAPGLSAADNTAANNGTPSDSTGAIGPSHYVELVNSKVGVFDRATLARVATADLDAFVGHAGDDVFDPQIQWDQQWGRWVYLADDQGSAANALAYGWSKTADPSDLVNGWCRYSASTGTLFDDFPKLGHSDDLLVFGVNQFSDASSSGTFVTAQVITVPKPADPGSCPATQTPVTYGSALRPLAAGDGSQAFTPVPANTTDSSSRAYVLAADDATGGAAGALTLWHADASGLVDDGAIPVGSFAVPAPVPQPGTSFQIDSSDARLDQVVARFDPSAGAEALWAQHAIAGTGGRSVVRWYEVVPSSVGTGALQQGTVSDPSLFVFNAAISPDASGRNAALFSNTGSATQLVAWRVQTHRGGDPPSTFGPPLTLATSAARDEDFSCTNRTPCRWGDYPGATPDPVAGSGTLVWGTGMLNGPLPGNGDPQWTTQNAAVQTSLPPVAAFTLSPSPASRAAPVSFDAGGSSDPDGAIASYAWQFGDGASGSGVTAAHTYRALGTFTVTLTVTDGDGNASSVAHQVTVQNLLPAAAFAISPAAPVAGQPVTFDGTRSADPDGAIAAYAWGFGSGAAASGPTVVRTFAAGSQTVTLTVTDADGATATATSALRVGKAAARFSLRARATSHARTRVRVAGALLTTPRVSGVCAGARVTLRISLGRTRTVRHPRTSASCRLRLTVRLPAALRRPGRMRVRASFAGSAALKAARSVTRTVR
ncbi:MAG TPA: PKD domain-containing protein [Solirubrobacteraceae bacterium]|nr:PKD domain-containing protein [Solirubrobacteraceae bacterium]